MFIFAILLSMLATNTPKMERLLKKDTFEKCFALTFIVSRGSALNSTMTFHTGVLS